MHARLSRKRPLWPRCMAARGRTSISGGCSISTAMASSNWTSSSPVALSLPRSTRRLRCSSAAKSRGVCSTWSPWANDPSRARDVLAVHVLVPGVVLAEIIHTVVVAIRRAHYRVNVRAGRLVAVESDARLMVELDEDHWAVDAVVENVLVTSAAHPHEIRVVDVLADRVEPQLCVARAQLAGVQRGQLEHLLALRGGQLAGVNADRK